MTTFECAKHFHPRRHPELVSGSRTKTINAIPAHIVSTKKLALDPAAQDDDLSDSRRLYRLPELASGSRIKTINAIPAHIVSTQNLDLRSRCAG